MQEVLNIARRQVQVVVDRHSAQVEADIASVGSRASAHGFSRSGRHLLEIDKVCAEAIEKRAALVWEVLHRCVTSAGVPYSDGLADELKSIVAPYLSNTAGGLTHRANVMAQSFGLPRELDYLQEAIASQDRTQRWFDSEVDLFCLALAKVPAKPHYSPHPIINIHSSTVGTLQTGDYSTASVSMSMGENSQAQVVAALETLRSEVLAARLGTTAEAPLVLIDESVSEMEKPAADANRVRSLLSTIRLCLSSAIDAAPKIPQAIESVQKTLDLCRTLT